MIPSKMRLPPELWFAATDGLKTVRPLADRGQEDPARTKGSQDKGKGQRKGDIPHLLPMPQRSFRCLAFGPAQVPHRPLHAPAFHRIHPIHPIAGRHVRPKNDT